MRKPLLFALVLALTAAAPGAAVSFSLYGSYMDTEDLGSATGLGLRLGFNVLPLLTVEVGGTYYEDLDELGFIGVEGFEGNVDVLPIDAGIRFDLGRPGGFYLLAGGTFFVLGSDFGTVDDEVGYYGGIGWVLGKHLYVEALYRSVEGTVDELEIDELALEIVAPFDIDLNGYTFNLGFRW